MHCRSLFEQAHDLKVTFLSHWSVFSSRPFHILVPYLPSSILTPSRQSGIFSASRFPDSSGTINTEGSHHPFDPPFPFLLSRVLFPFFPFFLFSHCSVEKLSQAIDASSNERCLTSADSCPSACGHAPLRSSRWPLSQMRTTTMRITVLGKSHRHIGSGPVPSPR